MIDLLKHSSQADRSLIAALYQRHAPSILTFIRRHIPSREDAEDALLEVFLAALESEKLDALNEGEQLAWLRREEYKKNTYHHPPQQRTSQHSLEENHGNLLHQIQPPPAPKTFTNR